MASSDRPAWHSVFPNSTMAMAALEPYWSGSSSYISMSRRRVRMAESRSPSRI